MSTEEKSKRSWADVPRRGLSAHLEYLRAVSQAFAEAIDTYASEHDAAKDQWLRQFPRNASKASERLVKGVFRAPQKAIDRYYEKEDSGATPED